ILSREIANFKQRRRKAVTGRSRVSYIHSPTREVLIFGVAWEWTVYFVVGRLAMPPLKINKKSFHAFSV
ncbi:MAG: hypothetical protein K2H79_04645, partial [Bacteroidaceae bacterium]|nr:hypothetical protein [Bacteroidaceae bacterium]